MFGTQMDDSMTMTIPLKPDLVVTGAQIHGSSLDGKSGDYCPILHGLSGSCLGGISALIRPLLDRFG